MLLRLLSLLFILALAACASTQSGTPSIQGVAYHQRVGADEYIVTAQIPWGYGPGRLRAILLSRANQLARDGGYLGFVVRDPTVRGRPDFSAVARVQMVRATPPTPPLAAEYFRTQAETPAVDPHPSGLPDLPALASAGVVSVDSQTLSVVPAYVNALDSSDGMWVTTYRLPPGPQLVVLLVAHKASLLGSWSYASIPVRAELESGTEYKSGGTVSKGVITVWIENAKTGARIASTSFSVDA